MNFSTINSASRSLPRLKYYLIGFLIFISFFSFSQDRCGTVEYNRILRLENKVRESKEEFENWIQRQMTVQEELRKRTEPYRIYVVVHIIHNGEPIGQGTNISNAQILSQIDVLNRDFNRQNLDAGNTPGVFLPVAGSMDIEFVLAQTDPNGLPSNGINRVKGDKTSWEYEEDAEFKALSYWPAENYFNIWVCNLNGYFGFTQFPVSSLPGLENSSTNRLTDGVTIKYSVFGSTDYGNFNLEPDYNKGRTTTHEVGHFLGLRHTWGDEDVCGATDYVDDTPEQSLETLGCPSHPQADCSTEKMFQNYLDYTDDGCMNLFTQGQVSRMVVVLENSPRRASLLLTPEPTPLEVQFPKIFSPNGDGVNDFWLWSNTLDYLDCKLTIFNRFGKPVFEMVSYDGSWGGRTNEGQILEEEAYYYVIRCDGKKEITGGVRIVR